MCKKLVFLISFVSLVGLVDSAGAKTLFHWSFDGTFGDELVLDIDKVSGAVATKFWDEGNPDPNYDVNYGQANPWFNTGGTSAQFANIPGENDPGAGLFVPDDGVSSPIDLSTFTECTIEAFVYPTDTIQSVIIRKYGGDGLYFIDMRGTGHFAVRLASNSEDIGDYGGICNDLPYEENEWHHVALVWDGSVIKFYVNGVQSQDLSGTGTGELPFNGPIGDSTRALGVGCIVRGQMTDPNNPPSTGQFFHGRIDEVLISDEALDPYSCRPANPASKPSPPNAAMNVAPEVVLSWTAGVFAISHDVYFGTDFEAVRDANTTVTLGVYKGRQDTNYYPVTGTLDLDSGRTYYWRIDEVWECLYTTRLTKGDVWSFTVEDAYTSSIGMEFVRIQPGNFLMGSENGDFDEKPVHNVTVSQPFYMSKFEVTNVQYEQFDPDHGQLDHRGFSHEPNEAVIFVSWEDANAFCEWLSQREGLPCRLPTEAEWEYACRAGTTTRYHTGDSCECDKNQSQTWGPHPLPLNVCNGSPNTWGLYDMHGNVEEWCYDWYGPYEANDQTDPIGYIDGDFKVSRGGSHSTTLYYLRSANRMGTLSEDKHWMIGFRVMIGDLPQTELLPPPQLHQIDVSQEIPPDIRQGPDPNVPYFQGPRTFVKISPGSNGPMFSSHNHQPAITHCPNGDLLAIWYSTRSESGRELAVVASRLRYGQDEWEQASPFWDGPDRNDHGNAIWWDADQTIYHFNGLGDAATWGGLALIMRTSTDNGATWSKARLINPKHGLRHQVIAGTFKTAEGYIIVKCDSATGGSGGTALHISKDGGQTWVDPGAGRPTPNFNQGQTGAWIAGIHAGAAQLDDGRLLAFGRGNNINGKMPMSISNDMAENWTYSASEFQPIGGGQRLVLRRLREGPLLFVSFTGSAGMVINGQRVYGMFAALSYDQGKTWPVKKLITAGGPARQLDGGGNTGWFTMDDTHAEPRGYLAATQTPDGMVHLISSALHYPFNLAWLEHKEFLVVDDFEAYTDDTGANPIFSTWRDRRSDPNNGVLVNLETAIVQGDQSMRVEYDNTSPYCEAIRTYSASQDWTESNVKALSLWFHGNSTNDANDKLYVVLKDEKDNSAAVTYDGDANDIKRQEWQEWNIALKDFNDSGIDLTDVNAISIRISGTGYGVLYFDDIRLYPTRCVPRFGPAGDISGDCVVDLADLKMMARDWLESEKTITGVNPDSNSLLVWYKFDEDSDYIASDSSGRGYDGYVDGPESGWAPDSGYYDGCRTFNDDTDVECPAGLLSEISDEITISVWLKNAYRAASDNWVFEAVSPDYLLHAAVVENSTQQVLWRAGNDTNDVMTWDLDGQEPSDIEGWHHWAFVKDETNDEMHIYFDGRLVASMAGASSSLANVRDSQLRLGVGAGHANDFIGRMDDFKIYDYALSQDEIVGAAAGGEQLYLPLPLPAVDLHRDGKVNFKDYVILANSWLDSELWPPQ